MTGYHSSLNHAKFSFKRGTHLRFNVIEMLKKMSLALLAQVETILKILKHFHRS